MLAKQSKRGLDLVSSLNWENFPGRWECRTPIPEESLTSYMQKLIGMATTRVIKSVRIDEKILSRPGSINAEALFCSECFPCVVLQCEGDLGYGTPFRYRNIVLMNSPKM